MEKQVTREYILNSKILATSLVPRLDKTVKDLVQIQLDHTLVRICRPVPHGRKLPRLHTLSAFKNMFNSIRPGEGEVPALISTFENFLDMYVIPTKFGDFN